jgi:hypothetical protein
LSASENPVEDQPGQNAQREKRHSSPPAGAAGGLVKWTRQIEVKAIRRPLNAAHADLGILAQIFGGRQNCRQSFPVIRDAPKARLRGLDNIWDHFRNNVSNSF